MVASVKLPLGSTGVYGACVSPDGRYAYVVHGLGRFHLRITQLERGWVNTFALSVVDIPRKTRTVTMLLDYSTQGAADPFDVVCSRDGSRLWVSHVGVHSISQIEIGQVHRLLAGDLPAELLHNIGVLSANEPDGWYNTPSLVEAYRTAPYLNDGRALTIRDVLTTHNQKGRHGKVDQLRPQEIDALVAYVLSL